jgi:hypothetical protein
MAKRRRDALEQRELEVKLKKKNVRTRKRLNNNFYGEFDPGSGRTLAACLIHASRANVCMRVTEYIHERRTGE